VAYLACASEPLGDFPATTSAAPAAAPTSAAAPGPEPGTTLAAIDIGTNSIHLVVARTTPGGGFETIAREKEMVRLGSGPGDMKRLAPDAIDRGVAALKRFRQVADISGASIRAVATSAVREAENRDDFVRRAREEAGIEVEVVTGAEEARLIHLGVLQAVAVQGDQVLLIDIGGGSTEFVVGRGTEVLEARSLKLGAIRLTNRFFRDEPLTNGQVKQCRSYVRAYLAPVARDVRRHGFDVALGSSGTILSIAEMVLALRGEEPGRTVGNVTFTRKELGKVVAALVSAPTAKQRLKTPGLDPRRADIIVAGAILLDEAAAILGFDAMTVSDYALREGILLDTLQRTSASLHERLADIRTRSVRHLSELYPEEQAHSQRSMELAIELFDGTADLHRLGPDHRELLQAAALLANVGLVISHDRHHLHSYYVIRNAEHLRGFTEREVELIAQVARYHRKSAPKLKHEAFAALTPAEQRVVQVLAGILRIAIALDRTHGHVVEDLTCRRKGQDLTVTLAVGGDPSLELYTAEERKDLLETALDVRLRFEVAG
jgi:exopolyphosphatase/guanosine-5'-triphosphate,3'-diphosphate pyrophosphatase